MKFTKIKFLLAVALCVGIILGCARLKPGADPIVVRAEQLETVADAAFDAVISLDNSNRGFWRTNAPAFHNFVEWLRTPVGTNSTGIQRRGLAMIQNLDDAKLAYRVNHSQSNLLNSLIADLKTVVDQAQSWQTIITTPTP